MEEELFDFEAGDVSSPEQEEVEEVFEEGTDFETENFGDNGSNDYITRLLENKGIKNRTIQITGEDGELQDVSFDDLSDQDKYDILSEQEKPVMPEDHEIQMINYLRQNNMTLEDFANWQKQVGVQEYLNSQQPITEFDQYSDEEMIAYDFIQRFGEDMSDEEIDQEIDRLKSDPEAYQKRVNLLRSSYKSEEEAQAQLYKEHKDQEYQNELFNFQNAYIDAANSMNYIQGMTLENQDKQELLDFVLTKDAAGRTGLSQALDNPDAVMKMAWFLLHGEETFDATVNYLKSQISNSRNTGRAVSRNRTQSKDAFKF